MHDQRRQPNPRPEPDGTDYTLVRPERNTRLHSSRLRKAAIALAIVLPIAIVGLWIAIHRVGWLGPWLADTARAIVGTEAVTEVEKAAYAAQDWWDLQFRADEAPKQYWDAPALPSPAAAPVASSASSPPLASVPEPAPSPPPFRPRDVGPLYPDKSTDADGVWVPISDPRHPGEEPIAFKTMLHPDHRRSWSEVFVVALDLSRIDIHYVLGRTDPKAITGRRVDRPALIPEAHRDGLVLAFNGGFKTEHRRYGVKIDDTFLVPGRKGVCTVALHAGTPLQVRTWEALEPPGDTATWLRQTPPCLIERGDVHPGLRDEESRTWGSLFGKTVIRRSAIGLDRDNETLFVAISNATTPHVMAKAMHHVGAYDAAQLDVNWSYTKILVFRPGSEGALEAQSLVEGFVSHRDEYLRIRAPKDFFYVVRK
ncbi:MAG: phosphodiester glycosidase family protein [Myxococcota bacterium]